MRVLLTDVKTGPVMGNKKIPALTLSFLLMAPLCLDAFVIYKTFYITSKKMSWTEARLFCQRVHVDMATLDMMGTRVSKWLMENELSQVWIGLVRDPDNDSVWKRINLKTGEGISGDDVSQSIKWATEEQSQGSDCTTYNSATEECHSHPCSSQFPPICYADKLVVVNENKTWEDALKHCSDMDTPCVDSDQPCKYRHDLLSLTYLSDYKYVRDRIYRATTDEVWTGLRFLGGAWHWVTGQRLRDEGMLPNCPSQWKRCGTLSKYDTNNWIIRDCSERRNFICYRTKILLRLANDTETENPKKNGHA